MQTAGEWRSAGVTLPDSFKATDRDRRKKNRRREGRKEGRLRKKNTTC